MNVDRLAFLAFSALIAGGTAACTAAADDGTTGDDNEIRSPSSEGGACFNDTEAAYPFQEGTCFSLRSKAGEDDYKFWTSSKEGAKTMAQQQGCTPHSDLHPAAEGSKRCPSYAADFTYGRCRAFVSVYKKSSAADAIACLKGVKNYSDSMALYNCGYKALDKACGFHPTAESTCKDIEASVVKRGKAFSAGERSECKQKVSGVREAGRQQLLVEAKTGTWFGIHSAIEGLDEPAPRK